MSQSSNDAKQDEERLQEIVRRETNRVSTEKYRIKQLGRWIAIPGLFSLLGFGYTVFFWIDAKEIDWPILIISGTLLVMLRLSNLIEEGWTETLHVKWKIHRDNPSYKWAVEYAEDHVYTDSRLEYGIYLANRVIAQALSIAGIPILALIAFGWLKNIGPASIISGLLVVLVLLLLEKQK